MCKLQAKRASLDYAGLTENVFWLPAKKFNIPGFFSGFFRAVKRPQKLNLELSFETQSSHQSFSAVKMKCLS
jgi:hypothetical protein